MINKAERNILCSHLNKHVHALKPLVSKHCFKRDIKISNWTITLYLNH